jgi:serine/threonine protein phosphatase PrpC
MRLRTAAHTDIGRLRRDNEDRFLLDDALGLYGVADGIGGLPGGAEAAECAATTVQRELESVPPGSNPDLTQIVHTANRNVLALGRKLSPFLGIGSTLTFAVARAGTLQLAHVGDSRCYVWSAGQLTQLSGDHNVECESRRRRAEGETIDFHSANPNALTRCIGQTIPPEVDLLTRPLAIGERYLFCTDGITRQVRDAELADFLAGVTELEATLREIIDLANERGGPDNATAVLVLVEAD